MMGRQVVTTSRTKRNPFAPIYVRCPVKLSRQGAIRFAERAVRKIPLFRHFDWRAFKYNPKTGRAVFL